ncbi:hypothetical protein RCL1_006173 [Eukaryota sp. TZLM3-RCL]
MHDTPPHTPPTPLVPVDPPDPSAILRAPIAFKRRAFNNPSNTTTFPVEVSNAGSMSDGMDEWPFYDLTIEEVEEKKTKKKTIKCSACGQPGHNKASKKCPKFPVDILEFLFMVVLVIQVSNFWKILGVLLKKDTTSV